MKNAAGKRKKDADRKSVAVEDSTSRKLLPKSPLAWTVHGCSKTSKGSFKKGSKFPTKLFLL